MNLPKDHLKGFFLENPEIIFDESNLSYTVSEIERIIDRFDRAAPKKSIHDCILQLLRATADFNYATVQDGFFSELRSRTKTDEELRAVFDQMKDALKKTLEMQNDFNVSEQEMLYKAIFYCKKSIKQQMSALPPDDKLNRFWRRSELKKMIE